MVAAHVKGRGLRMHALSQGAASTGGRAGGTPLHHSVPIVSRTPSQIAATTKRIAEVVSGQLRSSLAGASDAPSRLGDVSNTSKHRKVGQV